MVWAGRSGSRRDHPKEFIELRNELDAMTRSVSHAHASSSLPCHSFWYQSVELLSDEKNDCAMELRESTASLATTQTSRKYSDAQAPGMQCFLQMICNTRWCSGCDRRDIRQMTCVEQGAQGAVGCGVVLLARYPARFGRQPSGGQCWLLGSRSLIGQMTGGIWI